MCSMFSHVERIGNSCFFGVRERGRGYGDDISNRQLVRLIAMSSITDELCVQAVAALEATGRWICLTEYAGGGDGPGGPYHRLLNGRQKACASGSTESGLVLGHAKHRRQQRTRDWQYKMHNATKDPNKRIASGQPADWINLRCSISKCQELPTSTKRGAHLTTEVITVRLRFIITRVLCKGGG
ncbi:hypothetical protein M405DRAFT_840037 [Rhizopogon salebrosus TDB-379]|nr:hypothetical protein M405DRAFT_840037 [Rhizopogon salebrosus TDB-379]